jgi:phenylalanyl-tRNA synthetase alpha chain
VLPPDDRKRIGAAANELRKSFEAAFDARHAELAGQRRGEAGSGLDPTLPGRRRWVGAVHPVTRVVEEICEIFHGLGFNGQGPGRDRWYNFRRSTGRSPAMDMHDTLYVDVGGDARPGDGKAVLLRTHTSPVQVRTMLAGPPPVRVVIPGLVYRKDTFDPSHAPVFWQIEGLAVDRGISFVDLKGTLLHFARQFFSATTQVRFRPSYFPFTEPSAEMDVSCYLCGGSGCAACKGTGWMEILGCGMVHPDVLRNCGVDPDVFTGFAFDGPTRPRCNATHPGHPAALRRRHALPVAVRGGRRVNVSRKWLEAFLRRPLEAREVAERLAGLGAPVDAIEPLHPGLEQILVALVHEVRPHPNADRLRLCDVDDGSGTLRHVVCGAPNVAAGRKYPFAPAHAARGLTLERKIAASLLGDALLGARAWPGSGPRGHSRAGDGRRARHPIPGRRGGGR